MHEHGEDQESSVWNLVWNSEEILKGSLWCLSERSGDWGAMPSSACAAWVQKKFEEMYLYIKGSCTRTRSLGGADA